MKCKNCGEEILRCHSKAKEDHRPDCTGFVHHYRGHECEPPHTTIAEPHRCRNCGCVLVFRRNRPSSITTNLVHSEPNLSTRMGAYEKRRTCNRHNCDRPEFEAR